MISYVLRHLASIIILPVTAVVLIPVWLTRRYDVAVAWPRTAGEAVLSAVGIATFAVGGWLFGVSLAEFYVRGQGTLAPWDPPRHLVVRGPYRYVRNPMIAGVMFMLFGTAMVLRSLPHAAWAGVFTLINATYIPLLEEPLLHDRFGAAYAHYCRHVRRLIPRLRPWEPDDEGENDGR